MQGKSSWVCQNKQTNKQTTIKNKADFKARKLLGSIAHAKEANFPRRHNNY